MVKLIVSDIDGTLAPEGSPEIDPEYYDVITELTEAGVVFAAASGRQASSIDTVFSPVRNRIYYLGDNGACIWKYGKTVRELCMVRKDAEALLDEARMMPECEVLISTSDGFYTEGNNQEFLRLLFEGYKGAGQVMEDVKPCLDSCLKLSLYCRDGARAVYDKLHGHWEDRLTINVSGVLWVDFNDPRVSKGNAVAWLQQELGVTPEETVVFGDNFNDVSMLKLAERSYVPAQSHPDVKKAAHYEVAPYQENGVLQVLKQLLEEKKNEK